MLCIRTFHKLIKFTLAADSQNKHVTFLRLENQKRVQQDYVIWKKRNVTSYLRAAIMDAWCRHGSVNVILQNVHSNKHQQQVRGEPTESSCPLNKPMKNLHAVPYYIL